MTNEENIEQLRKLLSFASSKQSYRGKRSGEYQDGITASILTLQGKIAYVKECDKNHDIPKL